MKQIVRTENESMVKKLLNTVFFVYQLGQDRMCYNNKLTPKLWCLITTEVSF